MMTTQLTKYDAARCALQVASDNKTAPSQPGVYAFFKDGKCMYVGESKNLKNRLRGHERRAQIHGCEIRFHACDEHKEFEKLLIIELQPKKNGTSPAQELMQISADKKHSATSLDDRIDEAFSGIFGNSYPFFSAR